MHIGGALLFPRTLQTKATGVHLDIFAPDTTPNSWVGETLGPGVETTVTLSSVERHRLSAPYGFCTASRLNNINASFTVDGCIFDCLWQKVLNY